MTDFQILTLVFMVMGMIITLLVALINKSK